MRRIRKAKIIATLGPSSSDLKTIKKLFLSGADIFRLNCSHDVASTHIKRFKEIRALEKKSKKTNWNFNGSTRAEVKSWKFR